MKALFRDARVQRSVGAGLATWLRFAVGSSRWTVEGREGLDPLLGNGEGVICCFWHQGVPVSPFGWPMARPGVQEMRALISRSRDGALIAEVMERLGVPAIRGSKATEAVRTREKGGAEALRDMVRWVRGGGAVAITPDGPRGPARRVGEGPVMLAKLTRAPVFLLGLAGRPALRFDTWDRMWAPLPWGRGALVWDGPIRIDSKADGAATAEAWRTRLDAATARAEAIVA